MWNYRIVHDVASEGYEVSEVYYRDDGSPEGFCEATVYGETAEEVKHVYEMMAEALTKPVIRYDQDGFSEEDG